MRWLGKAVNCLLHKSAGQADVLIRGQISEELAARYLRKQGLSILCRNFRCQRGEIDLIAEDSDTIVFVEVRLRSHHGYGGAAASITRTKQDRIRLAAQYWFLSAGRHHAKRPCRFDALLLDNLETKHCEWIRDAFPGTTR